MNSMGFGYDVLKEINPRIVYCSISGFGARGPDRKKPGYDLVASGIGGLMSITGPEVCIITTNYCFFLHIYAESG